MPSEEPIPGRCGASVTDRVGLEVYDEEFDREFTDDEIDSVVLVRGAVTSQKEPDYSDIYPYIDQGFTLSALKLSPSEAPDGEDPVHVGIEDDEPDISHARTEVEGFCERYPMDDQERCYVHGGPNDGAPEGNLNAMTHGLLAKRSSYYDKKLDDEEKRYVEKLAHSWIDNAPFEMDNSAKVNEVYRIAIDQMRLWKAHDEFSERDFVYEETYQNPETGELDEVAEENPANLPYSRLDRDNIKKLKELGCLSDPESQKAEATESVVELFKKLEDE